ncbi:MAG: zinc ribbon domain-containing protein [Acidobacteriia bacterium]|nr:zinc ribbon domain-containing protein [Terriglobia bacterium]
MAEFCTNCGAPLAGAFCGRCGQRAHAQDTPAQPAASQPPAGLPKSSAPLLIIGGIVLVMFLAALGATLFGVHWLKSKVSSLTGGALGQTEVTQGDACRLLSPAELQQVLGVTVERSAEIMEGNEPGCAYYTNPAAFADLQKVAVEQARRDSEKASKDPAMNPKSDNPLELLKHTREMEGIVKGFGLTQPDKDGKVFAFTVDRKFGSKNWAPLRATMSVVPGFDEISGVGDRAMIGSFGHALYVLKGDSVFHLDTMYVPEARTRGSDIARKMISHL